MKRFDARVDTLSAPNRPYRLLGLIAVCEVRFDLGECVEGLLLLALELPAKLLASSLQRDRAVALWGGLLDVEKAPVFEVIRRAVDLRPRHV